MRLPQSDLAKLVALNADDSIGEWLGKGPKRTGWEHIENGAIDTRLICVTLAANGSIEAAVFPWRTQLRIRYARDVAEPRRNEAFAQIIRELVDGCRELGVPLTHASLPWTEEAEHAALRDAGMVGELIASAQARAKVIRQPREPFADAPLAEMRLRWRMPAPRGSRYVEHTREAANAAYVLSWSRRVDLIPETHRAKSPASLAIDFRTDDALVDAVQDALAIAHAACGSEVASLHWDAAARLLRLRDIGGAGIEALEVSGDPPSIGWRMP